MPYKLIGAFLAGCAIFFCGFQISNIRWERDFSAYKLKEKEAQDEVRSLWESKLKRAEDTLVEARKSESLARADTDRMRQQVAKLQRSAKTSESQWRARCADLAVRQKDLIDRAGAALEYCAGLLSGK